MAEPIRGIFVPNVVPLDEAGRIDEDELCRSVDWLIDHGVHGLYPNGSTSEFTRFTPEERRRINELVCRQAAGRATVLAGGAEANVRETLAACEACAGFGARAVAIVAPFYYRLGQEAIYAYFREIAEQTPIDITLYNIPIFASPIEIDTIRRLAQFDRIVAIKDSSGDIAAMSRMIAAVRPEREDFVCLSGWEPGLLPSMLLGAVGGTHASANVVPELVRRVYDLAATGDFQAALPAHFALVEFFDTLLAVGEFPHGFRVAAELRGLRIGPSRQPQGTAIGPQERERLSQAIDRALTAIS
ncbi:MAG: dihydrodipicolinate synthase family protein [Planctomycetota bacterium]|nr:MAG: dihydrodipicolinate synthase family protein [Planctomycetota bacterium]REJ96566.1 MAG: dihydrodipicolinate synthase family protein [Planctomycetota bacterium]